MHVQLGEKYRDTLTGYEGTATSRSEYLYGCVRVCLEGPDKDGKPDEYYFDEQRLVAVSTDQPVTTTATTGGSRRPTPRTGLR